ncbi:MAG: hypothetical protein ACQEP1_01265 [Nanobdellota archaeon]
MKKIGILIIGMMILMSLSVLANTEEGDTTVNITSARPDVTNVHLYDNTTGDDELELEAGAETTFNCTADVTDPNGNDDIEFVSAEIYGPSSSFGDTDFDDYHYTNSSCSYDSGAGTAHCMFPDVEFYAEPGEWHCQINATDYAGNENATETDNATLLDLAAIDISNDLLIDFGDVGVGDVSGEQTTNFNNTGNIALDVENDVYNDSVTGTSDADAMECDSGTIPVDNINASTTTGNLGSGTSMVESGTVTMATSLAEATGDDQTPSAGDLYWNLKVPSSNVAGTCNGKVLFGAVPAN